MHDKIRHLVEAIRLTFDKLHDIQFSAPWTRSPGRC